ncbi:hypothetical protein [Serratia fonticola]
MIDEIVKGIAKENVKSQSSIDIISYLRRMIEGGWVDAESVAILGLDALGIEGETVDAVREKAAANKAKFLEVICGYSNVNSR